MLKTRITKAGAERGVVLSASFLATVALGSAIAISLYRRARHHQRDEESSRRASAVTGTAFSAQEGLQRVPCVTRKRMLK